MEKYRFSCCLLLSFCCLFTTPKSVKAQCTTDSLALVALYNATNGANWTNKWVLTTPMSTWYGVTVNAAGFVTCLDLDGYPDCNFIPTYSPGNNLVGTIPEALNSLTNLTFLSLSYNQLTGSLPNFDFPNLTYFNLSSNQLTGSIPNFNFPKFEISFSQ